MLTASIEIEHNECYMDILKALIFHNIKIIFCFRKSEVNRDEWESTRNKRRNNKLKEMIDDHEPNTLFILLSLKNERKWKKKKMRDNVEIEVETKVESRIEFHQINHVIEKEPFLIFIVVPRN